MQDVDVALARNINHQCQTDSSMLLLEWVCRNNKHETHYKLVILFSSYIDLKIVNFSTFLEDIYSVLRF